MTDLKRVAGEWLAAKNIIRDFLCESRPLLTGEQRAVAILARLAHADPPLLLVTMKELEASEKRAALLRQAADLIDQLDCLAVSGGYVTLWERAHDLKHEIREALENHA